MVSSELWVASSKHGDDHAKADSLKLRHCSMYESLLVSWRLQ
jgi:hypothetical protein